MDELEININMPHALITYRFKRPCSCNDSGGHTLPEIRAICMAEIGICMKKFHNNFLDSSLPQVHWLDAARQVRRGAPQVSRQALQPLYATAELKGKLELFTSKFKDRIVAMTLDKEYDVHLVISILRHHRDILSDKDCEHVYELVYSSHRAVQAAGEFLNERLFVAVEDSSGGGGQRTRRGKRRLPNTPLIRDLVQFFIESELHEHGAYLVDSLIESNDMIKDWECMSDLMLEEPGPDKVTQKRQTTLAGR